MTDPRDRRTGSTIAIVALCLFVTGALGFLRAEALAIRHAYTAAEARNALMFREAIEHRQRLDAENKDSMRQRREISDQLREIGREVGRIQEGNP